MAKKSKEECMKDLLRQAKATDKHEEYLAKKNFEKKPKALRKYDRYMKMAEENAESKSED